VLTVSLGESKVLKFPKWEVWTGGHVDIIESEVYRGGKEIYLCPQKKQRGNLEYFNFHVSVVYLSSAPCLSFPFFLKGPNILLDMGLNLNRPLTHGN